PGTRLGPPTCPCRSLSTTRRRWLDRTGTRRPGAGTRTLTRNAPSARVCGDRRENRRAAAALAERTARSGAAPAPDGSPPTSDPARRRAPPTASTATSNPRRGDEKRTTRRPQEESGWQRPGPQPQRTADVKQGRAQ